MRGSYWHFEFKIDEDSLPLLVLVLDEKTIQSMQTRRRWCDTAALTIQKMLKQDWGFKLELSEQVRDGIINQMRGQLADHIPAIPQVEYPVQFKAIDFSHGGGSSQGLKLAVKPAKAHFRPDEDIVLEFYMHNERGPHKLFCIYPDADWRWTSWRMHDDTGRWLDMPQREHSQTQRPLSKKDFFVIPSGKTIYWQQAIRNEWLPEGGLPPGKYHLLISLNAEGKMNSMIPDYDEFCSEYHLTPWSGTSETGPIQLEIVLNDEPGVQAVSWGREVDGLQAGLALEMGKRSYGVGESVSFLFHVRNVADQAIKLQYVRPHVHDWGPLVRNADGKVAAVLPPLGIPLSASRPYGMGGGRIFDRILKPGEVLTLYPAAFTIQSIGWEGQIQQTLVLAKPGKYTIRHTLTFSPPHGFPGRGLWRGQLTTGEVELEVIPGETTIGASHAGLDETDASEEEAETVMRLLGDYVSQGLLSMPLSGDTKAWIKDCESWRKRCAALRSGEIDYLGYTAIKHPDRGYRVAACEALGGTGNARVAHLLVPALGDNVPYVRHRAARALGDLGSEEHIGELLRLLESDADSGVRTGAAHALGHIGSNRATKSLLAALQPGADGRLREAIVSALICIRDRSALPALREIASDPDDKVNEGARNAIRLIEDPHAWTKWYNPQVTISDEQRSIFGRLDVKYAAVATEAAKLPGLFEERPPGSKSYHLRDDVTMVDDRPDRTVYYLAKDNVFYIQHDEIGSSTLHYYGPFEGDPYEILDLKPVVPTGVEEEGKTACRTPDELLDRFLALARAGDPAAGELFAENVAPEVIRLLQWWGGLDRCEEMAADYHQMRNELLAGLTAERRQFYEKARILSYPYDGITQVGPRAYAHLMTRPTIGDNWLKVILMNCDKDGTWQIVGLFSNDGVRGPYSGRDYYYLNPWSPAIHPAWGETIELRISADDIARGCYIDFDNRTLHRVTPGSSLTREECVRLGLDAKCGNHEFVGRGGVGCRDLAGINRFQWGLVTPLNAQLFSAAGSRDWAGGGGPRLINTREGGTGVMFVSGDANNYFIRFKMLNSACIGSPGTILKAIQSAPRETAAYFLIALLCRDPIVEIDVSNLAQRPELVTKVKKHSSTFRHQARIDACYANSTTALAVTSNGRGREYPRLVLRLSKENGRWLVTDVQIEPKEQDGEALRNFLERYPDARIVPDAARVEQPADAEEIVTRVKWGRQAEAPTGKTAQVGEEDSWQANVKVTGKNGEAVLGQAVGGLQAKVEENDVPELTYSVTPRDEEISLGGSAWFDVELRNDGKDPVTVFWGDYAYDDQYLFRVTHNSGRTVMPPRKRFMPSFGGLSRKHFKRLPAGGTLKYRMVLTPNPGANCQTYYFREPGDYVVDARFLAIVVSGDEEGSDGGTKFRELWRGYLPAERVSFTVGKTPASGKERELGHVSVKGQVLDPDARPIAGADVTVSIRFQSSASINGHAMREVARQRTDGDGRFRIARLPDNCPFFELTARHPKYADDRSRVINRPPKSEYEARLILRKAMTIGGKVVDNEGNAIAGARVSANTGYSRRSAYTDAEGRFTLDGVVSRDGKTVSCNVWKKGWLHLYPSISVDIALSRTWKITMESEEDHSFAGRAVYADGDVAADMKVIFDLANAEGQKVGVKETTTNGEGRFTAIMKKGEKVSGRVSLEEQVDRSHLPHGLWQTTVTDLRAGRGDVEFVFDRSGVIRVDVEPTNVLPTGREFRVTCRIRRAPFNRSVAVGQERVGSNGGTVKFPGLSSGAYRIKVDDPKAESWNWTQDIELAAQDGQMNARLTFRVPELHFGSVRARVLGPDGQTPLNGHAWMDSSASWGRVDILDGDIWLPEVPVGNVLLSFNIAGYAPRRVRAVVRPNQTTDFGDIILATEEQGTGWVQGRILFDDGTPALGAGIIGDYFKLVPVKADGSFRRQLPIGKLQVAIDISGAPLWPRSGVSSNFGRTNLAEQWDDKLFLPLDVKPGETIQRDISIPLATLGKVEVKWMGDPDPSGLFYALAVRIGDAFYSCRPPSRSLSSPEMFKDPVTDVPAGHRIVILRTSEYGGYQESRSGERNSVFTFDPSQAGSVSGTVKFSTGAPAGGVRVELLHPLLAELGPVRDMRSTFGMRPGAKPGSTKSAQDGSFRFPRVAPGRYVVSAASSGDSVRRSVEVSKGEETLMQLTIRIGR
jgi:hypothetical protein